MNKLLPILAAIGAATLFLSSCASTPTTRIEKNQGIYNQLSLRDQELVSNGKIEEGMSAQAVYLAFGSPDRKLEGESNGLKTMRWDYTSLTPIYTNRFYGGFGYGGGCRYRRRGFFGFSPRVDYIPSRSATVWFEEDRVRSWERVQ